MMITTQEAAELMGVSRRRVLALLAEGRVVGARRVGPLWLIPVRRGRVVVRAAGRGHALTRARNVKTARPKGGAR